MCWLLHCCIHVCVPYIYLEICSYSWLVDVATPFNSVEIIKTSGSESCGQEEAACLHIPTNTTNTVSYLQGWQLYIFSSAAITVVA